MTRIAFLVSITAVLLFTATTAQAETTLCLPRQFTPAEMGTVGIAFMNPTLTDASLTLRLRNAQGSTLTTSQRTLPAKNQMALSLAEIFPASAAGWLSVDTDVDQVSGFWLTGDYSTSTDGAPLINATSAYWYPAQTFFTRTTEISVANLGTTTATGNWRLFNASGATVATVPFTIPALGLIQQSVATLFPAQAASFDTTGFWIGLPSSNESAKLIATSVTTKAGSDNFVVNSGISSNRFLFPHVVDGAVGGSTFSTPLTLTNYQVTQESVTLTLRQTGKSAVTIQRTIPALGVLRSTVAALFGLTSVDGWLLVEASANMGGVLAYTDSAGGGSTAVPLQSVTASDTALIFGHIADIAPWWTGIALVNSSTTDAQIEVYALEPDGDLIAGPDDSAKATFVLPAQTKRAFLLSEVLPQTQTRSSDGGYVYIKSTNGVAIHGTELFFLRNGRVYAGVPATRLGGFGFIPAGAACATSAGGDVTVESVFVGDATNQPLTSVQPGQAITVNMRVNNTTGGTVCVTRQYRATGPNGYVLTMASVAGDLPAGRSTRFSNVTIPSSAPAGTYRFTGTVDFKGTLSTSSTSFALQTSTSGGGGTGGGSTSSLRVLTNEFSGVPVLSGMACYDPFTKTSKVNAITLLAQGGSPHPGYTWTLENLSAFPPGTTVDPLTGIFHGTGSPLVPSSVPYSFNMVVSDGSKTATGKITLTVDIENSQNNPGACPTADFSQPWFGLAATKPAGAYALPAATQGVAYGSSLEAILGRVDSKSLVWSIDAGQLPPGMTLDSSTGVIYNAPTTSAAGSTYAFRVKVTGLKDGQRITASCGGDACPYYSITVH